MKVAVVIPACNEERAIGKVVAAIPRPPVSAIIVVNNNSSDHTAEVARAAGAQVVEEPRAGYGAACLTGVNAAEQLGADLIVFLDGDYSDYPEEIPELIAPILAAQADMVIGSRILGQREPGSLTPQQRFGGWLACRLMKLFFGAQYTDLGPFRAITLPALRRLNMQDRNYGWTVEMQIKAARAGLRVQEIPVRYRRRIGVSKVSGTVKGVFMAGCKILWTIFKYAVQTAPQGVESGERRHVAG
ncbi:MAG: glycosyltransferase family 2 protein [candidate division KSB1 bacterium]|nr:glycosyltransferase family 2 protein [candidate division KSB1 bacterium]MDZ7272717.1 glycosyltransferase family 2 protein [candidate division KSB1 bacterium]MDZ7284257.1 glycosyltransferase family 2 protein [candidate division KSB1 bacterium]MDZ7297344.1 glycosyltransferase family 2 protein [candidate division KSB1 bacterium]MDZ7307053.1 glycosyltransferase family 2 protein [candidate division KSB1 bacterium]